MTFSKIQVKADQPTIPDNAAIIQDEVLFDKLSNSLQLTLANLQPGELVIQSDTGSDRYAIRLEKVSPTPAAQTVLPERQRIREMLIEYKRQQLIAVWLEELRKKASITIHNG